MADEKKTDTADKKQPFAADTQEKTPSPTKKNDAKTLFHILADKTRKKQITNSDRKEVKQTFAGLAAEISGGYRVGKDELNTLKGAFVQYRTEMNDVFNALPDTQKIAIQQTLAPERQTPTQEQAAAPAAPERPTQDAKTAAETPVTTQQSTVPPQLKDPALAASLAGMLAAVALHNQQAAQAQQQAQTASAPRSPEEIIIDKMIELGNLPEAQASELQALGAEVEKDILANPNQPNNFAEQLKNKVLQSGNFNDEQKNDIVKVAEAAEKAENIQKLNAIMAKGHESWDDNDIAQLQFLAKSGVNVDEINAKLAEHEAWVGEQEAQTTPAQEAEQQVSPEEPESQEPEAEIEPENSQEDRDAALASLGEPGRQPFSTSAGKIKTKSIIAALNSSDPDKALANVDDLLYAQTLYKNKEKEVANKKGPAAFAASDDYEKLRKLNTIVEDRLSGLSLADITPANAASYRLLCLQCGNEEIRNKALNIIADGIIKYDKENFGSLNPDTNALSANYEAAQSKLNEKDPFAYKYDANKDIIDLNKVEFTDEYGNVLSEKKTQRQKEAIAALAREMAAQRMAKKGKYTDDELEAEFKNCTAEIVMGSAPKAKDGKIQVNKSTLASTIANQYLETEKFKDRCQQKFKNIPLVKKITKNVKEVDDKLTKRYGKTYIYAKQALKFAGKISGSVAKNAAIYGIAGLVPGGTAVVIGYNIAKNWKSVKQQLKDPNASMMKKCAIIAGAGATTALSGLGIASSLGTAAEAANMVSPGMLSSVAGYMGQFGTWGRMGISAAAATLPNTIEGTKLKIQSMYTNLQIKTEKDGEKLAKLIAKQKQLQIKTKNNAKEFLIKGASLASGMALGQAMMPFVSELIHNTAQEAAETVKTVAQEHGIDPWSSNAPEGTRMLHDRSVYDPEGRMMDEMTGKMDGLHHPGMPDDVSGFKPEENLAAAKAENSSGLEGKSAYAHTVQHLETLGDSRLDPQEVAGKMAEHLGAKANLGTIACKMAPYALQDALHLDLPEGQAPTTHNMIQYISEHGIPAEKMETFNKFMSNNFEGTQFKTENFASYQTQTTHTEYVSTHSSGYDSTAPLNARHENLAEKAQEYPFHHKDVPPTGSRLADVLNSKYATTNDHGSGFHFEPLEKDPVQQPQQQEQQVHHQTEVRQPEVYIDPVQAYAQAHGLVYDPYLSNGLNRLGNDNGSHDGFLGAFVDTRDGSIVIPSNNPMEKPATYSSYQAAKTAASMGIGAWDHSGHNDNGHAFDPDKKITRCFGNGIIGHNNTISKVITGINTAAAVVNTVNLFRSHGNG